MGKVGFEMQCYYCSANAFSVVYFCCTLLWLSKKKEKEKEESDDGHNGFLNLQQQTTR